MQKIYNLNLKLRFFCIVSGIYVKMLKYVCMLKIVTLYCVINYFQTPFLINRIYLIIDGHNIDRQNPKHNTFLCSSIENHWTFFGAAS